MLCYVDWVLDSYDDALMIMHNPRDYITVLRLYFQRLLSLNLYFLLRSFEDVIRSR
jgi:hypothetical protein